jgi:hypothetical protein
MLNGVKMYWLVASRAVLYFFQTKGRADSWEWMWNRVHNPQCRDFESKPLIWALLYVAWKEREHIRVLATYRDFEEIVTSSWNEKWRERILATVDDAESVVAGKPEAESERDYIVHRDYRPRLDEQ